MCILKTYFDEIFSLTFMRVLYIMDNMIKDGKDIKDSTVTLDLALKDKTLSPVSYTKTNKLITALYMVTDTIDKEEPMRLKLRTLGIEILSDSASLQKGILSNLNEKINAVLSFLNIASDVGMFSEMNCNILRKEFIELKQSIQGFTTQNHLWLEEFIQSSSPDKGRNEEGLDPFQTFPLSRGKGFSKRQGLSAQAGTRIGVQKGSTLMKALSNKVSTMSLKNSPAPYAPTLSRSHLGFEILKSKRREEIIAIIKACPSSGVDKLNGMSIKDIALAIRSLGEEMGEKTLQRELVSMIKDNVLKKTGAKRWSQYFLN